ncbi:MAG: alpha/beta fold hydrolase [Actinophytocola sp.]|nr:alpha/beta fold hydrolase [Actinophytocola sp.]
MTFVLIPGAGGQAWYFHRLVPELRVRGHDAIAVDLPAGDNSAGLVEYADVVVDAIDDRTDITVVAQSLGGFTAPLVCERADVSLLVMLNAMTPQPGEAPDTWWEATGHSEAKAEYATREGRDAGFDLMADFFHDVPQDVIDAAMAQGEPDQSMTPMRPPWPLDHWPDVPTRFLQGRDDRFFPLEFQRRVVKERLALDVDEMPGGHLVALSRPAELAERLVAYRTASAR